MLHSLVSWFLSDQEVVAMFDGDIVCMDQNTLSTPCLFYLCAAPMFCISLSIMVSASKQMKGLRRAIIISSKL
jgi:hypothetical protein